MNIEKLWEGYLFPKCENCKKECVGHLDYGNLCSNLNYLKEYGQRNMEELKILSFASLIHYLQYQITPI